MDPDGDLIESIAWWDPAQLAGNPAVRPELAASLGDVLAALGCPAASPSQGDESVCPCGVPVVYDELDGWQHGDGSIGHDDGESVSDKMAAIAKAGQSPKAGDWPGWKLDRKAVAYWAPLVTAAVTGALPKAGLTGLASAYLAANPAPVQGQQQDKRDRSAAVAAWLAGQGVTLPFATLAAGILADGYLIGSASATALATGSGMDTGDWKPGDSTKAQDQASALGAGTLVNGLPGSAAATADQMAHGYWGALGVALTSGQDAGLTAAALGAALAGVLADGTLAAGLVADAVTSSSGQAAQAVYQAQDVSYGRWVTDPGASKTGPCPLCLANEAAGRVPIGEPYPSGDTASPAHPRCNCQVVPD